MDFRSYDLSVIKSDPSLLYGLADGVLQGMATSFGYDLGDTPTEDGIFGLVGEVGANKELQLNKGHAFAKLGDQGTGVAANWLERSGVMESVSGPSGAQSGCQCLTGSTQ